jgi:hypothetical protein
MKSYVYSFLKSKAIHILYFILAFIVYNIFFIIILDPSNFTNITMGIALALCSFITSLIFPKGFYTATILGLLMLIVEIDMMKDILNIAGSKIDKTYMIYYIYCLLLIIISAFLGSLLHKKISILINKITRKKEKKGVSAEL